MNAERRVREVRVGDCIIGGSYPIRVQSMTTTDTKDVQATADQAEALAAVGCEIVRVTAPSQRDAEALAEIRAELDRRGVGVPLVADIHFTPNAALLAAEAVEKVRVNPGNFADKKRFEVREYTDAEYAEEVARVADRFRPLVRRCRELGRALRIGTNHGSLSDRVLNRYGDTPRGMVESAIEFLDVCEDEGFHDVIFSMKASNPLVAIHAYRALAAKLEERAPGKPRYPFHVGVTEAGDGEDGRVKSAIGIGALLTDGLGETVRVSLTEDPVREIPVARALANLFASPGATEPALVSDYIADRTEYRRRVSDVTRPSLPVGGDAPVRVELIAGLLPSDPDAFAHELEQAVRATGLSAEGVLFEAPAPSRKADVERTATRLAELAEPVPLALRGSPEELIAFAGAAHSFVVHLRGAFDLPAARKLVEAAGDAIVEWSCSDPSDPGIEALAAFSPAGATWISVAGVSPVGPTRSLVAAQRTLGLTWPVALRCELPATRPFEQALLEASARAGSLLSDGIGDVLSLGGFGPPADALRVAYRILQGARQRTSWTEFISCPSCGRTLFDLEETTARVKERTAHLPGLKIAVMGCVVNGPGEMADADFGYVGSGHDKVSLYVGQNCVVRNVPQADAPDRLVDLIREDGRWEDPS